MFSTCKWVILAFIYKNTYNIKVTYLTWSSCVLTCCSRNEKPHLLLIKGVLESGDSPKTRAVPSSRLCKFQVGHFTPVGQPTPCNFPPVNVNVAVVFLFILYPVAVPTTSPMREREWIHHWINSLVHHFQDNAQGIVNAVATLVHCWKVRKVLQGIVSLC